MKFTPTTIKNLTLPDGLSDKIYFDDDLPGFGLRLRRSGDRSWWAQYAIGKRTRKLRLGSVAELDIGKARAAAKTVLARVRLGGDPASERAGLRVRAGETIGVLLRAFMIYQQGRLRPRSLVETDRHLLVQCRPLHSIPIATLSRRTIAAHLAAVAQDHGPAAANRVRGSLGAFCTWAIREGLLDTSPVSGTNKAIENGPRSRLLSDDELVVIWRALDDDQYGVIVRLLILTGLRRGEVGGLRWSEISPDAELITLPASRTKAGREHVVPVTAPVKTLLMAQPRDGSDLVFGTKAIRWAVEKRELDQRIAEAEGEPLPAWVVHDFRRLFSTTLHDRLGVPPHIVECLLGHVSGGSVARTYNKAEYVHERQRALARWAEHIEGLITGTPAPARVVQLRKPA